MASVNKVIIIGNLGKDPELRETSAGGKVCNVVLATSRTWKSKTTGEKMEETEWHRVSFFDRLAEIASEYLKKGRPVYVEGRLKTRKWTDKDGAEKYTTEIIAESLQMLGDGGGGERRESTPKPAQAAQSAPRAAPQGNRAIMDMDDDIPF